MHALITRSPILDNSFSHDYRDAAVFDFQEELGELDEPHAHTQHGLAVYDPEYQPAPSFQAGDRVNLHGSYDPYGNFFISHFEFLQTN